MSEHVPFPDPACRHPGEREFLAAVLADSHDDLLKHVYADWLEERGDERADQLRAWCEARAGRRPFEVPAGDPSSWHDLIGLALEYRLRSGPLRRLAREIMSLGLPAVRVSAERRTESRLPLGASRFGGLPDVPNGFEWPRSQGRPGVFVAGLNLAELSSSAACRELPQSGHFLVFAFEDYWDGDARVVFVPGNPELASGKTPADELQPPFPSCRLRFHERMSLPTRYSAAVDALNLTPAEEEAYSELGVNLDTKLHQILGHAVPIQNEIFPAGGDDGRGRLLFQIDGDAAPGWEWGDSGVLYFTVPTADLRAGRFDRVALEMQCC